jgi:ATP-dependent DNA ligase
LELINPRRLAEPFDHAGWVFEIKFDGFRAAADTVHGRLDLAQRQLDAAVRCCA